MGGGTPAAPLRLLTFTTLYPNAAQPNHGVFVENRLRHLVSTGAATSTVLAPVPYVPGVITRRSERWRQHGAIARRECRHGLTVHHPGYVVIPRYGMSVAPALLYATALRAARRLRAEGVAFDLIDAHYVYPDGVAAVALGRALGVPVVVTARGSDVTQLPDYALPRWQIRHAVSRADGLIGVSAALARRLVELGAPPERVRVLRNGVDTDMFHPIQGNEGSRDAARHALGLDGPTLISVGHLIERKGHDRVIAAFARLSPDHRLLIVGEGPERAALVALAERLGVAGRVQFLGSRPHAELPALYGAADVLVLASSREGWANVLLEAMACGTPVVASPIPGNDEVVQNRDAGMIAAANTPDGLAAAIGELLAGPPSRHATRAYAERFGWGETSNGQLALFRNVLAAKRIRPTFKGLGEQPGRLNPLLHEEEGGSKG